jgi:ATP-dependent exoDNAse (exonuclease V) beta subunit
VRPLNAALYPPLDDRQSPRTAAGVPAFAGKDTVLERPDGGMPGFATVRPGVYDLVDPASGDSFQVVWWDPLLLEHRGDDSRGLRRDDLIAKDARPEDVETDRARHRAWQARLEDTRARAARPSLAVLTATEFSREHAVARPEARPDTVVAIVELSMAGPRPAGRRFGVLVHALLAAAPLDGSAEPLRGLAAIHSRVLGAPDEERDAAVEVVTRALAHPLLDEARAALVAGRPCYREAPISIMRDGLLIDGQIDLAFHTGHAWMVIDFKTDAEMGVSEDAYRRQVALYAEALTTITGQPARATLLRL